MLGEKLLNLRKQNRLSQEELGEKIGVTRQTISNWELGQTSPNPEQLKLLSTTLNTSIDELLENNKHNKTEEKAKYNKKLTTMVSILFIIFFIYSLGTWVGKFVYYLIH